MEETKVTHPDTTNTNQQTGKLRQLLRKKWFVAILACCVIVLSFLTLLLPNSATKKNVAKTTHKTAVEPTKFVIPTEVPITKSPAMEKAIEEAKKGDSEYNDMQNEIYTNYPWIRKLPLTGPKYFVYFDVKKKEFIGRLYTQPTDNIPSLETYVKQELTAKGVAADKYPYVWQINP